MLFTLEPLPAKEGDCLLLHWGTLGQPKLAVIDGGPGRVWETSLLPRLEEIRDNRHLDQLTIDLVMVSHVDNDHVVGIKKLFRRLKSEVEQQLPANRRWFSVKRLWHNTFNDVLGDGIDAYYKTLTAALQASVGGAPNPALIGRLTAAYRDRHGGNAEVAAENAHDVALILAGHGEARTLRDDHAYLRNAGQVAALNSPFQEGGHATLITAGSTPQPLAFSGLTIRVVGPAEAELRALQKAFDRYVQEKGLTAEAMLAAYSDDSVPNLSSIVCLVEMQGRRILLTGDARGDKILAGLSGAGLLPGGRIQVDVLKVPHHGSDRNVTRGFFEAVRADTYVLSGDGKHGNPERETLEWLIETRAPADTYTIVLTYAVAAIDAERERDAVAHGKPWSASEHSLSALFAEKRNQGYRFRLLEGAPVTIDLGDESPGW